MDPSFQKDLVLISDKETQQKEERLPLHTGYVVKHYLEIIIFIWNNPQSSERHMKIEAELIKLLVRETKLEDSFIKQNLSNTRKTNNMVQIEYTPF